MKLSALFLPVAAATMMISTNCATMGPPQPPSLDLPKPPQDLRAARKGNRVTLTWTVPGVTTDRQTIRAVGPTRICRSTASLMQECGNPVGEVDPTATATTKPSGNKISASFTDTLPSEMGNSDASASISYALEVLNSANRGAGLSNEVRVPLAPTLPPPQDFRSRVTTQGIVLIWTKSTPPVRFAENLRFIIRIYRHEEGSQQETVLGEAPIDGEPMLTDSNIEWEKTYEYRANTVTVVQQSGGGKETQVEGDDTPEIKVFAHDLFPPAVPSGLQAVFSGPGQSEFIDLVWAPVTDPDLAGYNVYRHEQGTEPVKLNSDPLKMPAYRDNQVSPGKRYFYTVTSIDIRRNESSKSEEASEIVP